MNQKKFRDEEGSPLIPIVEVVNKFDEHLKLPENQYIFFSGEFGSGKSFFLREYFEYHRKKEYNSFFISPVNYVVSENAGIFELIKVDIIRQLFAKKYVRFVKEADSNSFRKYTKILLFYPDKIAKLIAKPLSAIIPGAGAYGEVLEGIDAIREGWKELKEKLSEEEKTEIEKLEDFWSDMLDKPGTHIEFDLISSLIYDLLQELALDGNKRKKKKKNVLIIDDLDRMDPEHVFRMLNIFSAHRDGIEEDDKFGFDHVILVGDIENIRKIYFHRYGREVDFHGYFNKFYSKHPFVFTNRDAISTYLHDQIFLGYPTDSQVSSDRKYYVHSLIWSIFLPWAERSKKNLRDTLKHLDPFDLQLASLTIWSLPQDSEPQEFWLRHRRQYLSREIESLHIDIRDFAVVRGLKYLAYMMGGLESLRGFLDTWAPTGTVLGSFAMGIRHMIVEMDLCRRIVENDSPMSFLLPDQKFASFSGRTVGASFDFSLPFSKRHPYDGSVSYLQDFSIRMTPDGFARDIKEDVIASTISSFLTALVKCDIYEKITWEKSE